MEWWERIYIKLHEVGFHLNGALAGILGAIMSYKEAKDVKHHFLVGFTSGAFIPALLFEYTDRLFTPTAFLVGLGGMSVLVKLSNALVDKFKSK